MVSLKGVHFQIVVNNSEWGNIFILKQNMCTTEIKLNELGEDIIVECNKKKCPQCSRENICVYADDNITSIANKTVDAQILRQSNIKEFDELFSKQMDTHISSRDGRKKCDSNRLITIAMSGYFLSKFYKTLISSSNYRRRVRRNFFYLKPSVKNRKDLQCITINLVSLGYLFIDYKWNDILMNLCLERRELDHAMSWLSTLGGAFSALGDYQSHFAQLAGRTSINQFKLALRLGDDRIVARCKLYFALSLIQTGRLRAARKIIKKQYKFATNCTAVDERLIKMCVGIWAKMKYEQKRRNKTKSLE